MTCRVLIRSGFDMHSNSFPLRIQELMMITSLKAPHAGLVVSAKLNVTTSSLASIACVANTLSFARTNPIGHPSPRTEPTVPISKLPKSGLTRSAIRESRIENSIAMTAGRARLVCISHFVGAYSVDETHTAFRKFGRARYWIN